MYFSFGKGRKSGRGSRVFDSKSLRLRMFFRICVLNNETKITSKIAPNLFNKSPKLTELLNDLSYEAMWQIASAQLDLGLSVVIDSPLSRRAHLNCILELAAHSGARVVVVECKPRDEAKWRRRLEWRSEVHGSSWHKPSTWQEMEKLLEGYEGCWDYDIGNVPRFVVDTTCANVVEEVVTSVLEFVSNACGAKTNQWYYHCTN
ncbi:hypothetical protein RND71_024795 [Anisodus tanguticus]|uniref:Uncharacterized protein n=1 Tax=Anisodus tanguticus TaxID=243964 RepID=A0AAE1VC03_9SOLA|nr:hypothetical protein RND71_024795 [Anisodus tanguticus]